MPNLAVAVFSLAALLSAGQAHAANWTLYLPAITGCDSHPFPSCRARTTCQEEGKYWYNGQCNEEKHPDQEALEKLDGSWETMYCYPPYMCIGIFYLAFSKDFIGDDNLNVIPFVGNAMTISGPDRYGPPGPDGGPSLSILYATVGRPEFTYAATETNIGWGFGVQCWYNDGDLLCEHNIEPGDTGIYSFNLTSPTTLEGRACFVNADVCFDLVGEKVSQQLPPVWLHPSIQPSPPW